MGAIAFEHEPVLVGSRVRLRPFREDDLDALWEMLHDEQVRRLTGTHTEFTREAVEQWYRSRGKETDRLDLAIATLEGDACVGEVVVNDLDAANRSCGFRISLIGPSQFGHGYGTEATRLMMTHAFEIGVHRVELEVFDFNPRARDLYGSVGFVVEGVRREALLWDGEYHDAVVMGLLSNEWDASPP